MTAAARQASIVVRFVHAFDKEGKSPRSCEAIVPIRSTFDRKIVKVFWGSAWYRVRVDTGQIASKDERLALWTMNADDLARVVAIGKGEPDPAPPVLDAR